MFLSDRPEGEVVVDLVVLGLILATIMTCVSKAKNCLIFLKAATTMVDRLYINLM